MYVSFAMHELKPGRTPRLINVGLRDKTPHLPSQNASISITPQVARSNDDNPKLLITLPPEIFGIIAENVCIIHQAEHRDRSAKS